ncbi:hypothetical protein GBF38_021528, partial [Nibea albiflora]
FQKSRFEAQAAFILAVLSLPPPSKTKIRHGRGSSVDLRRAERCLGAQTSHL